MNVLVADRDQGCAAAVARALRLSGMVTDVVTNWSLAVAMSDTTGYDVVIMDGALPDSSGETRLPERRESERAGAALLVFANRASGDLYAKVRNGADASISKPFAMDELVGLVRGLATRDDRLTS